jgi:hypothetical protein
LRQRIIPSATSLELDGDAPLTDEEFDRLMDFLDEHVPFGGDGFLGLLHAVAVAPSEIPASRWMRMLLTGQVLLASEAPEQFVACERFAAGYVAGAELDPEWRGNADRWTFAGPFAYLCGRRDLVCPCRGSERRADS